MAAAFTLNSSNRGGNITAVAPGGPIAAQGNVVTAGNATTASELFEADVSIAAVGFVNGKNRQAQTAVAKRFITPGNEHVVVAFTVEDLGNVNIHIANELLQSAHTGAQVDAFTGHCLGKARIAVLQRVMAANYEMWNISADVAHQLPVVNGCPQSDAFYQMMRVSMKTLRTPAAALPDEVYGVPFAVTAVDMALRGQQDYMIPTVNVPGSHLPMVGTTEPPNVTLSLRAAGGPVVPATVIALNDGEVAVMTDVSRLYIRILIQAICLYRYWRESTPAEVAQLHLGFTQAQLQQAAFAYFAGLRDRPNEFVHLTKPTMQMWVAGTRNELVHCTDRFSALEVAEAQVIPVKTQPDETVVLPAGAPVTVPDLQGFTQQQSEAFAVMAATALQLMFLICYHMHTNSGHHWYTSNNNLDKQLKTFISLQHLPAAALALINALMHDLFHPYSNLDAIMHTLLSLNTGWMVMHDNYLKVYPFSVPGTAIFGAGAALARVLCTAMLPLRHSSPNTLTLKTIKRIEMYRDMLEAAERKVQEQPLLYAKECKNAQCRKTVENQQEHARKLCAEMTGIAVQLGYVGATTGLRVLALPATPATPAGASPVTELDAPVIMKSCAMYSHLTKAASELVPSLSKATPEGSHKVLEDAATSACKAFAQPMIAADGTTTAVLAADPMVVGVVERQSKTMDPGTVGHTAGVVHQAAAVGTIGASVLRVYQSVYTAMCSTVMVLYALTFKPVVTVCTYSLFGRLYIGWGLFTANLILRTLLPVGCILFMYELDWWIQQLWDNPCTWMAPTRTVYADRPMHYSIKPVASYTTGCGYGGEAVYVPFTSTVLYRHTEVMYARIYAWIVMQLCGYAPVSTAIAGYMLLTETLMVDFMWSSTCFLNKAVTLYSYVMSEYDWEGTNPDKLSAGAMFKAVFVEYGLGSDSSSKLFNLMRIACPDRPATHVTVNTLMVR